MNMTFRLGRAPHDPDRLAAAFATRRHVMGSDLVLPALDRSALDFSPGLYRNDTLPDCTAAGMANAFTAASLVLTGAVPAIDSTRIPLFYAACVGCAATDAAMAATDGAVMLDVLDEVEASGFDVGQQVPLVSTFAVIDPSDRTALAHAISARGAAYLGIQLTEMDMTAFGAGTTLNDDVSDHSGIVGGHCLVAWSYTGLHDTDTVLLATWGRLAPCTWRWLGRRLDEAYSLSWPQLESASGAEQ